MRAASIPARVAALLGLALTLSSCVAAAIPLAAGGLMARKQLSEDDNAGKGSARVAVAPRAARTGLDALPAPTGRIEAGEAPANTLAAAPAAEGARLLPLDALPPPSGAPAASDRALALASSHVTRLPLAELPAPTAAAAPATAAAAPAVAPGATAAMRYLYGSGEAAALSLQAYQSLWTFLSARAADRASHRPIQSVVLSEGASLSAPRYETCGNKPLAVVFDIDETVVLNLGYDAQEAAGGTLETPWRRWRGDGSDVVAAVPGAAEGVAAARREGITVIFNSGRSVQGAPATVEVLDRLGFGPVELGRTLRLRGDGPDASGGDAARRAIARDYCVVALVGDQLDEFSDLFERSVAPGAARRTAATETMVAPLWGAGWFMLPNPVYSTEPDAAEAAPAAPADAVAP